MKIFDTIAAISTPQGTGGVAMIRISGTDALAIAASVFKPVSGKSLAEVQVGRMVYGRIFEKLPSGEESCIDDGMAVYFKAPHSFTTEDTVEISCHGGSFVSRCVLSAVLSAGARHASAGEFTRRAFLGGRIDLSEAEAIGKLLEAKNINQLHLARGGISGILTDKTAAVYDSLREMLGSIYAKIDFPDEDLAQMSNTEMREKLESILASLQKLAATYRTGRAVNEGIKTVICGRTNAGKSSVYNRLTGDDSAIVTDIEGTTRDILKETVTLGRTTLRIYDTAGLRVTDDAVENIGIERALSEIASAELVLAVFDTSRELSQDDIELMERLKDLDCPTVALLNKSDIGGSSMDTEIIGETFKYTVNVSAKEGSGFDELTELVESIFIDTDIDLANDAVVADARQYASIVSASEHIRNALCGMIEGIALDLCCIDIEAAMQALGELEGREVGEEIVSEIFSKFCVGK